MRCATHSLQQLYDRCVQNLARQSLLSLTVALFDPSRLDPLIPPLWGSDAPGDSKGE